MEEEQDYPVIQPLIDTFPEDDWRNPYIRYLLTKDLPDEPKLKSKILRSAWQFEVIHDSSGIPQLHKKSKKFSSLHRCISKNQGQEILREIHQGSCGNHFAGRSLANKAYTQGYWWPYMREDAQVLTRSCEACQKHENFIHTPADELHPMLSPWPFAQWGLDIVGPLPKAPGSRRFLLVATDYFTKWVEAKPLVHITADDVRKFLWEDIICRFGIPHTIVTDNGKQFVAEQIEALCRSFGIRHHLAAPYHPEANGQAEATNKTLINTIKKRLKQSKGKWVEELPAVLWAYRTTPKHSTGLSPFHLAFGTEVVLPTKIMIPTSRTLAVDGGLNDPQLQFDHANIDELRDLALHSITKY